MVEPDQGHAGHAVPTYIQPHVGSAKMYGSRVRNGVCTLFIMIRPVTVATSPVTTMARW